MKAAGFIIHHSACSGLNGRGYDYLITRSGIVVPAERLPVESDGHLHICIEGDFSRSGGAGDPNTEEQLFLAAKLIARLSFFGSIPIENVFPHSAGCPGEHFPWAKLVISISSGYH